MHSNVIVAIGASVTLSLTRINTIRNQTTTKPTADQTTSNCYQMGFKNGLTRNSRGNQSTKNKQFEESTKKLLNFEKLPAIRARHCCNNNHNML